MSARINSCWNFLTPCVEDREFSFEFSVGAREDIKMNWINKFKNVQIKYLKEAKIFVRLFISLRMETNFEGQITGIVCRHSVWHCNCIYTTLKNLSRKIILLIYCRILDPNRCFQISTFTLTKPLDCPLNEKQINFF